MVDHTAGKWPIVADYMLERWDNMGRVEGRPWLVDAAYQEDLTGECAHLRWNMCQAGVESGHELETQTGHRKNSCVAN